MEDNKMPKKTASQKLEDLKIFIPNAKKAISQFEELMNRLESDKEFCKLWEEDSSQALVQVGINPDARMEMGYEEYSKGPQCNNCVTPNGNACHC